MSQVVIGDILPYTQATATGGQTVFMTNWTANVASDVVVYKTPAAAAPNDVTQILAYPAGYSVAFIGAAQEVQVTLTVGAVAGDIITITRQTPADRMNLYSNTNFTPSMLNNDFGILTLVDQQAQLADQKIGPRYNYSAIIVDVVDTILPILEANESWRKNADNDAIEAFIPLSGGDVGDIKFIIQQPNSLVPQAQALSVLTTGIMKSTTTTGVISISPSLTSLDSVGIGANQIAYGSGVDTYSLTSLTAFGRSLIDDADAATARTTLGLVIGTNVQAWDATLQSLSALGTTSDRIAYTTGVDTWAETPLTSFMRTVLDDANAADAAATLAVLPLAGGTMTGPLVLYGPATTASEAVTLAQVQAIFQNEQIACLVSTDADMPTWTYNNGTAGVGATLTAPINGATTFDGVVPANGQRVFVNLQTTNPAWQGPYTVVQGTGGTPTVLTRATDWDTASEMQPGDVFSVVSGTTYGASQWMFSQTGAITVGTTALTFTQMVGQGALLKANNLSDLPSPATARINLGLVIGTNVQAYDGTLQSISGLGTAANKMIYTTGVDTWAETDANAFGRSLLNLTPSLGGIVYSTATLGAILSGIASANHPLMSGNAAAPTWSTAAYPDVATGAGKLLQADGTNWVASTPTYPTAAGSSGNVLTSDGTNWLSSPPSSFIAINVQVFTASGTYTPTAGTKEVEFEALGGGAGGAGAETTGAGQGAGGGGGGGGGYGKRRVPIASIVGTASITIGALGAGGAAGANAGSNGGTTTIVANAGAGATLLTANGGTGGNAGTLTSTVNSGSPGGSGGTAASDGDVNSPGWYGLNSVGNPAVSLFWGGAGGNSIYGAGAKQNLAIGGAAGVAGTGKGSGGSGAVTGNSAQQAGGNGTAGLVIATEFI